MYPLRPSLSRDSELESEPSWVCAKKLKSSATSPPPLPGRGGGVRIKLSPHSTFTLLWGYMVTFSLSLRVWPWASRPAVDAPARPPFTHRSPLVLTALQGKVQWQWVAVIWMRTNKNRKKQRTEIQLPPASHQPKRRNIEKQKCAWKQQWYTSQTHIPTHTYWTVVSSKTNLTAGTLSHSNLSLPEVTWWGLFFRTQ